MSKEFNDINVISEGLIDHCDMIDLNYSDTYGCNVARVEKKLKRLEAIESSVANEALNDFEIIAGYKPYNCADNETLWQLRIIELLPTVNWENIKQTLIKAQQTEKKLSELKEYLRLQSYHCVVEIKESSLEKAKTYTEYQEEINRYKELKIYKGVDE